MTAINFPAAPATGTTHTEAGITWTFDGTTWDTTGLGYVGKGGDTMTGNLTVPSLNGGQLAGFRNILINGDLKINQRGVTIAAAAVGAYGPDRWKKVDAGNMTQIVEDGNFVPGATYTLSGTGVTTQQLTAPASGNWTLPNIPIAATNIQLEQGTVATPFEHRPIGVELMLCQRYYESSYPLGTAPAAGVTAGQRVAISWGDPAGLPTQGAHYVSQQFIVEKRSAPSMQIYAPGSGVAARVFAHKGSGTFVGDAGASTGDTTTKSTKITASSFNINQASELSWHYVATAEL
jgi:hypothetical protein